MTFEEWAAPLRYPATLRDAYLAGQASARSVYDMSEIALLRDKCAELERERDQWKYTAEIRQQHLEYTIKAQAGEPIYGMAQQRQLNPSPQVRSDVGSLGNTYPTTERRETLLDAHARQVEAEDCATFAIGDTVRKTKGSQWHGTVVGTYSTSLTPEGYCVESSTEKGSVQIYPAAALERA